MHPAMKREEGEREKGGKISREKQESREIERRCI